MPHWPNMLPGTKRVLAVLPNLKLRELFDVGLTIVLVTILLDVGFRIKL